MRTSIYLLLASLLFVGCNDKKEREAPIEITEETTEMMTESSKMLDNFSVTPISHATMVLQWDGKVFYIDPVGGATAFDGQPDADAVLITDIHGDHFNMETLTAVAGEGVPIIAPQAVADKIDAGLQPQVTVLNNGATEQFRVLRGFTFEAVPMYNLREEAKKFHTKGRGNGYLIYKNSDKVYISGDTEDIPEMRSLQNIDVAFVCMNLPYTMTVESAAGAVNDFKPAKVYPYHYRGADGLHDVAKFKQLVNNASPEVEVIQLNWYPNRD